MEIFNETFVLISRTISVLFPFFPLLVSGLFLYPSTGREALTINQPLAPVD